MADKKPEQKADRPAIHPTRIRQAEYAYERWRITVENGTTIEDLTRPAFYAHVATHFRPGSIIEAMPDNRAFFAELIVIDSGQQYVKTAVLREVKLEAVSAAGANLFPGYSAEFAGDHLKWRVIRESDRKSLKDGLPSQTDAFSWLSNHLKAMAA